MTRAPITRLNPVPSNPYTAPPRRRADRMRRRNVSHPLHEALELLKALSMIKAAPVFSARHHGCDVGVRLVA
jgi:hypothetical protein